MAEPILYVMAHGGKVYHFIRSADYEVGAPAAKAICGFTPQWPWAWSGLVRNGGPVCPACLSQSQFYEVPGG